MNRCVFIVPYFGRFNNYFPLFLQSCACNENFDWLIFTDDKRKFNYPRNVKVHYCTFVDIQEKIEKLPFTAHLDKPYKLCDYRPAYGYLFAQYLQEYEWWGYCDIDLLWGRIDRWITEDALNNYDKIGIHGHCTLIRNCEWLNKAFLEEIGGICRANIVFNCDESFHFDEEDNNSINTIFKIKKYKIMSDLKFADIYTKSSFFCLAEYTGNNVYKIKRHKGLFVWNNGSLLDYRLINDKLTTEEYMYIHLQKRSIHIQIKDDCKIFKIIPNKIEKLECYPLTAGNYRQIRKKYYNFHYIKIRYRFLKEKLKKWQRSI